MPFCVMEEIGTFKIRNTKPSMKNEKEESEEREG